MVKSSPHTLGRKREYYVFKIYQKHGWNASLMPGSAGGRKGASIKPIDIIATKVRNIDDGAFLKFLNENQDLLTKLKINSEEKFNYLLIILLKKFLKWKKKWKKNNTLTHLIQVKKDKTWLKKEEKDELIKLSHLKMAEPIFVFTYENKKRKGKCTFLNLKNGELFTESSLK